MFPFDFGSIDRVFVLSTFEKEAINFFFFCINSDDEEIEN